MQYIKNKEDKIEVVRHGELLLAPITSLPKGLKKADTNVIIQGSHDNPHAIKNCDIYFKKEGDYIIGYLEAKKGAKIFHKEHGAKKVNGLMEAALKVGAFELRQQAETTHEGMRPVVD